MKHAPVQVLHFSLTLNTEFIDLNNLLKVVGVASSGAEGKLIVASGIVTVDDVAELRKTAKIRAGQRVKLKGRPGVCILVHAADASPV